MFELYHLLFRSTITYNVEAGTGSLQKWLIDSLSSNNGNGNATFLENKHLGNSDYFVIRELKQTRRRRKRERHLKIWLRFSAIIFQLVKLIMLQKCVPTIQKLIWNQRLGHKRTKLNICHHMLTSSTQLENMSFHVVESTRTSTKCLKMKTARAKRAKILFLIAKYANFGGFCCRGRRGCLSSLLLLHFFLVSFIVDRSCCKWTGRSAVEVNTENAGFTVVCSRCRFKQP